MSHKLKPSDLTSLFLAPGSKFQWGESSDRVLRYDRFVEDISAMFAVVQWDHDPAVAAQCQTDLFYLSSDAQLRELINQVKEVKPNLSFNELSKCVRKKIRSENPPLLQLAKLLSSQQKQGESFEQYYNRVVENSKSINWDMFNSSNFEKVIIATTFASGCSNPYVKGHCMSVRDLNTLKLEDMKTTASEYELKNPSPACFPAIGPPKSLFGPPTSLFGSGSGFGSSESKAPIVRKCPINLFGTPISNQCPPPYGGPFSFGSAQNSSPENLVTTQTIGSFEENRAQTKPSLFGASTSGSLFGGFGGNNKNSGNIFMKSGSTDEQATSSSGAKASDAMEDNSKRPRTDVEREPEVQVTNKSNI